MPTEAGNLGDAIAEVFGEFRGGAQLERFTIQFDQFGGERTVVLTPLGQPLFGGPFAIGIGFVLQHGERLGQAGNRCGIQDQVGFDFPVFVGDEGSNLSFAFHHQTHRHRLHPAGRESTGDPLPQQRGGLVAHDAIEDAAGLLSIDPVHVDGTWLLKGFANFTLGDGIEDHPLGRVHIVAEGFGQVPRNGFTLTVKVGGKPDGVGGFGFFPKLGDGLLAVAHHLVARLEIVFEVDPRHGFLHALARFGRQVTDMAHTGLDVKSAQIGFQWTQVLLDRLGFRRAFHNHQVGGVVATGCFRTRLLLGQWGS